MEDLFEQKAVTCCFSGHRPDKLPSGFNKDNTACSPLRLALREAIKDAAEHGYRNFLSGMALGIDTWAAEEVLALRENGKDVRLIAALPCPNQDSRWQYEDSRHFQNLLKRADDARMICGSYSPFCMGARNLWMVERSSLLIAVFDGSPGGTFNTIGHAKNFGLRIQIIPVQNYLKYL